MIDNKFALVFAGGGGKGAYEIGVWKALSEKCSLPIGAVSGSSVGALNAAMFAIGELETAEKLWTDLSKDKVLTGRKTDPYAGIAGLLSGQGGGIQEMLSVILGANNGGFFSKDGLEVLIKDSGIPEKISSSTIPCYVTCTRKNDMRRSSFLLNKHEPREVTEILLASSAIPFIFPPQTVNGEQYIDGGLTDNIPAAPLYDTGWRKFIVVHLEQCTEAKKDSFRQRFPDAGFIHISPEKEQGGFMDGTLDFSRSSAERRISEGYSDTIRQIESGLLSLPEAPQIEMEQH
ncbi:MAG: patatin-like phospholipase family protein [Ruminococcus sp.]|nr:patatin-like phospholipase family protein [Ruminococcus sp.]